MTKRATLGALGGVAILSTSLLGTGVFVLPAIGLMSAGRASMWSWLLTVALMLPIALTFGALGARYPHAGGVSHWVRRAAGLRAEWVLALVFLAIIPVGLPAAMNIALVFAKSFLPEHSSSLDLPAKIGLLAAVFAVNWFGIKASAAIQGTIALLMLGFVFMLLKSTPVEAFVPPALSWAELPSVFSVMATLFWCFLGIEIVANLAEEFDNPAHLSRVILLSLFVAGSVYYACSALLGHSLATYHPSMMVDLTQMRFGAKGQWIFSALGLLACFASINTYFAGYSRQIWSLANEGKLPAFLAYESSNGVPKSALCALSMVSLLSMLVFHFGFFDIEALVRMANSNFVLVYLGAMLSAVVLLEGKQRVLAMICALLCVGVLAALGASALYGLGLTALFYLMPHRGLRRLAAEQAREP